jgi:hypothetical protein
MEAYMSNNNLPLEMQKKNKLSGFLPHWLQTILWIFFFLFLFEIGIRTLIMKPPLEEFKPGWGMVPVDNSYEVVGYEGYSVTRYVENGEIQSPFTDGTSVVVLGDSTTKGAEVADSEKYVNLTESILRERGLKVDLHNLGSAERNIADSVYQAPAVIAAYSPKIVVVQANLNTFEISFEETRKNHFVLDKDEKAQLVHRDETSSVVRHNIVSSSGLLSFIAYRWMFVRASMETSYPYLFSAEQAASAGPETSPEVQGGRNAKESVKFLAAVRALMDAYPNSKIVFLIISQVPKVPVERSQEILWVSNEDELLVDGLLQMPGVYVVYPNKAFQQQYEQDKVLPRGFFNSPPNLGHLNEYGNEAVAAVLADALEAILR